MNTVAAARIQVTKELRRAHVESPELTADLLIGFALGWDRVRVLSHPEHILNEEIRELLQGLLIRRIHGEPLQYLTGEREFYGHSFRVTPDVLIPRPETEFLVEKAIDLIREKFTSPVRFADIGTGSGCIAISVLCEIADAVCFAVDCSESALEIAKENAIRHGVETRIAWICADLFESLAPNENLDLVLSNPPYIPLKDYNSLSIEVRDFEPHQALFGGESGLDVYRRLIPESLLRLVPGGYLLAELGAGQADVVNQLTQDAGLLVEMIVNDLQGIPRCLVAQKPRRRTHG